MFIVAFAFVFVFRSIRITVSIDSSTPTSNQFIPTSIGKYGGGWKRLVNQDYKGWKSSTYEVKVTADDIKKGRRYGLRWAFSEFKGTYSVWTVNTWN